MLKKSQSTVKLKIFLQLCVVSASFFLALYISNPLNVKLIKELSFYIICESGLTKKSIELILPPLFLTYLVC